MKPSNLRYAAFYCLAIALASSAAHAEIYKWVDANGKTHYSDSNDAADPGKTIKVKPVTPPPESAQSAARATEYQKDLERQFNDRQLNKAMAKPAQQAAPQSLSGGRSDNTNASRCNLARDVLSGAVRHTNGATTDDYDKRVAENDVRAFCPQ
jgi:hypothetical protein